MARTIADIETALSDLDRKIEAATDARVIELEVGEDKRRIERPSVKALYDYRQKLEAELRNLKGDGAFLIQV